MKKIVAIVGMPGSGKSVFAQSYSRSNIPVIHFGSFVTSEVRRRGLPLTPDSERSVREELRKTQGMDVIARLALPEVEQALLGNEIVVIDGLYSFSEYKFLLSKFPNSLYVVAIVARRALRYERLSCRKERPLSPAQALTRDIQEIEKLEKGGPIAMADVTLVNDGTAAQLLSQANDVLRAISSEVNEASDEHN